VRNGDFLRWIGGSVAVLPALALGFILVTLLIEALPAIRVNGLHFFTGSGFNEDRSTAIR